MRLAGTTGSGSDLYDGIVEVAGAMPEWVRGTFSWYTDVGLLIFGALFALTWWRARGRNDSGATAVALLAPAATVVAYVVSEVLKTLVDADRPCRALPVDAIIERCPEVGDWSFPSNHATIASAAAVGLALAWRALVPWVAAMALLMVFSRVFVGVHYPRDVVVGLLLGAAVAWSVLRLVTPRVTALVLKCGDHPGLGRLLHATPPDLTATRRIQRLPLPGRGHDPRRGDGR